MNNEHIELLQNVDETICGYGDPSPASKSLISEGLVEVEVVSIEGLPGGYWKARLTKAGKRALKAFEQGETQ